MTGTRAILTRPWTTVAVGASRQHIEQASGEVIYGALGKPSTTSAEACTSPLENRGLGLSQEQVFNKGKARGQYKGTVRSEQSHHDMGTKRNLKKNKEKFQRKYIAQNFDWVNLNLNFSTLALWTAWVI